MNAPRPPLPDDLQARLEDLETRPFMSHRAVRQLHRKIAELAEDAYARGLLTALTTDRQELLDELMTRADPSLDLSKIPIGNSDTGNRGYEQKDGVL